MKLRKLKQKLRHVQLLISADPYKKVYDHLPIITANKAKLILPRRRCCNLLSLMMDPVGGVRGGGVFANYRIFKRHVFLINPGSLASRRLHSLIHRLPPSSIHHPFIDHPPSPPPPTMYLRGGRVIGRYTQSKDNQRLVQRIDKPVLTVLC